MKTASRAWGICGHCSAALLLIAQSGCLFDQLRPTARPAAPSAAGQTAAPDAVPPARAKADLIPVSAPAPQQPKSSGAPEPIQNPAGFDKALPPAQLALPGLIELARQHQPSLSIAQAKVETARGQMIQAGLYPNPTISLDWDTIGTRGSPAGEPGALIAQEFVTAHKLKIARAAGEAGVQAADWDATTRWYEVVTRVRIAYIDLLAAERGQQTAVKILEVAEKSRDAANKRWKGGLADKTDLLRAETELEQARVQVAKAKLRITASRQLLAAAVGVPQLPGVVVGSLEQAAPMFGWSGLPEQVLTQSSEVQSAQARVLQMEQRMRREEVERIPNVLTEFRPYYSTPDRNAQVEVIVGAKIPLFNRNQGNILAAQAQLVQARADVHHVELTLMERLTDAFRRYQLAQEQVAAYRDRIIPKATETVELVQKGYTLGEAKYSLTVLLLTQQTLFQAELSYVASLDELWRAVADIEGLLQRKCE